MSQSIASTSSTTLGRGEAGPLPKKLGEFGYDSAIHGRPSGEMREVDLGDLPARHPADRDHLPNAQDQSTQSTNPPETTTTTSENNSEVPTDGSAASTMKKGILKNGHIGGIHFSTIFRIFSIIAFMVGTGLAWFFTITKFMTDIEEGTSNSNSLPPLPGVEQPENPEKSQPPFQSIIFVHVAFTLIAIFECLFMERAIFHARAERYIFVHGMSSRALRNASMGIAPWNRPPLPTYAAALAESGVGTGDVEDNMIAIPPPPAYGNNRGSTLLLSSMLPAGLLRTLSRTSERSETPPPIASNRRRSQEADMEEGRRSRPLSYGASQEVDDAQRALDLETALAKLERTRSN